MKTVRIQNLGNVSFPDEMSEEDIVSAIEHDILPTTQLEAGLRPKHESVVWPSIKRTGGRMLSGLGTVLEDVTGENAASRALTDTGKEIISANPPPIQSFSELVASPWTAVKQFAAEQIPQVGAAALGARAGATLLAPFGPAAASAGAIAGGLGAIGIQEYAEIRDKQKQQGRENIPVAVLAAAAAAGLERLGVEKLAGDLLTKPAIAGIRSALKQGGKRGVEALLVEAPPEFLQTVVERAGGFESLTSPEAIEEYKLSTAAGAIGGPAIGGPLGVLEGATSAPPSRPPSRPPRPEPTDAQHRAVLQALEELRRAEDGDGGQVDPAAIRAGNEALRTAEAELTTPSQPAEEAPPETVEPAPPPAIRDLNDAATDLAEALKVDRPPPSTEGAEATQVPTTEAVAATASEFSPVTEGRPSIDLPPTLEQPPSAIEIEIPASGAMAQLQGFLGVRPAVPESTTPATPESIATRYPSVDKYSNYLRGRYGVNQWNEWRRDGSIARWWAEAHGEAPGAAQAEPATVGVPAEERPAATVEAKPKARKSRLSPSTEPRLRDPAVSGAMADLVKDAGWATRGGLLIRERDEEGNAGGMSSGAVTGRTKWEPKAEWYLDIAQKLSADGKAEQEAVRKAIAGEPLTAKEKRFITEMADVAESYLRGGEDTANTAERAPTAVTAVPETDVEADKEAELERLAIQAENDLPAVPDDELASEQSSAMDDWLREIEADEQQNADARSASQGEGQARAQDAGEIAARASAATGDEGNAAPRSDRLLEGYDQAELDRRAAARAAAEKKAADEAAEAERKAQADRDRSDFRLAGSSSEADRAASYGQQELQPTGANAQGQTTPKGAPLFAKDQTPDPTPWRMDREDTIKGPMFVGDDVFLDPDGPMLGGRFRWTVRDTASAKAIGSLVMAMDGDQFTALHSINAKREQKVDANGEPVVDANGRPVYERAPEAAYFGRRVLRALTASNGAPFAIRDIVRNPATRQFYEEAGAHDYTEDGRHAVIDWRSYAATDREIASRVDPRGDGGALSEGRRGIPGVSRGESARSQAAGGTSSQSAEGTPRQGLTVSQAQAEIRRLFGKKIAEADWLHVVESPAEIPAGLRASGQVAVTDPNEGPTKGHVWIVASRTTADSAFYTGIEGIALHEGLHAGLEGMLGRKHYNLARAWVRSKLRNGSPDDRAARAVAAARALVPNDTAAQHVDEETLAYLVQDARNHDLPMVKRILAWLRAWAFRLGWTKNLTPETLAELARMAIHARTRGVVSSPGRFAKSARAPDDLFGAGRPGYRPITDAERKRLVIPPAWTDVYIAEDPNAKLVAYGTDKKGRTQPRYSREHTAAALQKKFFRARQFNAALPQMLQRIEQDADAGIEEAVVLEVIAHTGFRIGNQKMLGDQEAFGATTLKPEHVLIDGDLVAFNFPGKRGKLQDHRIDNARLARHLSERQQRGNGRIFTTSDAKVRAYLHSIAAQKFKVHDFRTWNATKAARQAMAERPVPRTPDEFWDSYGAVGDAAADKIGDTRKVALESYVDPLIFSEWREHAGVEENATRPPKRKRKAAPEADRRAADDGREHAGNERLLRGREVRESSQQALSARGPDVERGAWSPEAAFESSAVTAARARLEPWIDELRYQAQDRFHYLNKAQRAAADARGLRELPEAQDAYLAELRYHGMAAAAIEDFQRDHVDPMLKAMQVAGLTTEQVDDFLHARHAPEANAQLQRINPNRENNEALSGMSNDEAAAVIEKARKAGTLGALEDIGRRVDEITQARRDLLVASGLETPATIERWEATYGHYVPLKREGFEDAMPRRGRGFDLRGKEKRRVGSTRDVEHILANVVAQHEATIVRAEKAKVGRALLEFARENPDPALFEVDQLQYRPTFDADGLVTYRPDPGFILADNVLVVRENGHDHRITFNEANPDAMKIAAAMKNLGGGDAGAILNVLTKFSRFLSLVNTGANPEFIISNFARDAQTAGYNLSGTEADNLKWQILRDAGKAWAGIRKFQKGQTSPWAAHFDAFRKAGAQTGWMEHYKDISDREKALIAKVHNMGGGNWQQIKRGLKAIEQFIEQENTAVENAIRLSTFVHARQAGMTEAKAARLAKEITVNFNRRGNMGQTLNAMYLFYNASIQGSVRILQALASSSKVRKLAVATIVGAALLDMWNRSMGDDDDDKPNPYDSDRMQHVKERNLVLMLPSGRTIMIPLPWGYNVLHVMGQAIGETLTRPDATLTGSAGRVAASVVDAFNPIGGSESILQMVSPTITDPMVQWFTNEDWKGDPLRPADNPFGVDKPDSQKYWNSVRAPSKWVTERLNALTGGDEVRPGVIDISPELIDLLIDTFTGGAGRFVTDTLGTPWKAVKGEDVETYEVPLLRKVYRVPGMGDVMQDYYKNRDAVALTAAQVKHYQGDQAKIQEIRAEHMAELRLVSKMKLAEARLAGLRKMRKATTEQSRLKEIDEKIKTTMEQFNAMYYQSITG